MAAEHIPNSYDIPEHGIYCEVVYTQPLGGSQRAIGPIAQAYGYRIGARTLRLMAAGEALPLELVPATHRDRIGGAPRDADEERYLIWYDYLRGDDERVEHGALVDALIADRGITGEIAR